MDSSNESNNHEKDSCQSPINTDVFLHYSLIPSVLIILVLSFLERRAKRTKLDDTIQLLDRRFGFVIPLDLLGTFKNRWTFGFAFGAIANKVISLFFEEYLPPGVPPWARALGLFAGALEVGLSFYPIFACLTTNNVIVGSLTGFLYTLTWFVVTVMDIVACPHGPAVGKYESIIYYWPSLLCLIFLMGRFVHKFIKSIRILLGANIRHDESCFLETHQAEHVKRLFRKPTVVKKTWFEKNIYTWDPCFRFPSRMIGTSVLSIFCLYILVLMEYSVFRNIVSKMMAFQESLEAHAVDNSSEGHDNKDDLFADFTKYFIGVWYFTNILSCAVSVTYIFHILACYRKHMKRLWRGEKEFLPVKYRIPSSTQSVTAIARYTGWQVAYILWGYLILHIVQGLFAMAFIYAFIVPLRSEIVMEYLEALGLTILTLSIVLSLGVLQIVLAGQFFLQKKISPEDRQKPLALNNRKAFHNFNYFFFFYNVILGLSACLLRLFTGLILGSLLMARIDRTILQRGYESADMGYKTWIGMIFVDHYHTNPVLVCFNNILLTAKAERRLSVLSSYSNLSNISVGHNPSVKARTRWLLSYTLLKNPRLMLLRKKKETDDTDSSPTAIQSRILQATAMEAEMRNNHKPVELHNVEIRTRHPIFE